MKDNRFEKIKHYFLTKIDKEDINKLFRSSGLQLVNATKYQIIRYVFVVVSITGFTIIYYLKGGEYPTFSISIIMILFLIASPKTEVFRLKTPFKITLDAITASHRYKQNLEIYRSISQLKNLAIIKKDDPKGSKFILEQLRNFTKTTRPVFNRMISLWDLGKQDEACTYFEETVGTSEAKELSGIFKKLDSLNPNELTNQLEMFQSFVRRERETRKKKGNESKGNFIYLAIVFSAMFVLINFAVVVFFIESAHQLNFIQ